MDNLQTSLHQPIGLLPGYIANFNVFGASLELLDFGYILYHTFSLTLKPMFDLAYNKLEVTKNLYNLAHKSKL